MRKGSPGWRPVVLDVETTGLGSADRIVEIATLDPDTLQIVEEYDTLVNPLRDIPSDVSAIHGLTASDLEAAPTFSEIAPAIATRIDGAVLIARRVGRVPVSSVTKKLDLLVAADPASHSTKTVKARSYGIHVMDAGRYLAHAYAALLSRKMTAEGRWRCPRPRLRSRHHGRAHHVWGHNRGARGTRPGCPRPSARACEGRTAPRRSVLAPSGRVCRCKSLNTMS